MIIYKITNKVNNKIYIGQTRNQLKNRWRDHIGAARRGSLAPIHQAIRKYSAEQFKLEILEKCSSLEEMNQREIDLISFMKPQYNIHHGGNSSFTEEHGKRVREAMMRPEVRKEILKTSTDPKTNKRLRKALKEKVHSNKEVVKKMIQGGMQFAKKIKAINIKTGKEMIFNAQRIAERELNIPNSSIRKVLNGKLKQTHGFKFVSID